MENAILWLLPILGMIYFVVLAYVLEGRPRRRKQDPAG
jgi:hypothetical protein